MKLKILILITPWKRRSRRKKESILLCLAIQKVYIRENEAHLAHTPWGVGQILNNYYLCYNPVLTGP